jgi:hypothetical protein
MRYTEADQTRRAWMAALVLLLVLAPALLSAQDLTVVSTTTVNGRQTQTTQYVSPIGIRTAMGDGSEIILRLDQKKMYIIHPAQKTYSEMTFDEIQKAAASAAAAMENLPPEAAAQMKKMMGGMGVGEVTVTKVGPGETIAGYATEKYHVVLGSFLDGDIWAAPALPLPAVFYDAMRAATPATPMMDMKKLYEEYKKINGLPLKTVTNTKMMGQSTTSTTLATSVDKRRIPAGTFDVPAGFKPLSIK